jgi:uncharacterized protein YegP (UPF0339 family)
MKHPTLTVFKGKKEWYVHLKGRNGQIMMVSEGYTTRTSANRAKKRILWCMMEVFTTG